MFYFQICTMKKKTEQNFQIILNKFFEGNVVFIIVNCNVHNIPLGTENLKCFVHVNRNYFSTKKN